MQKNMTKCMCVGSCSAHMTLESRFDGYGLACHCGTGIIGFTLPHHHRRAPGPRCVLLASDDKRPKAFGERTEEESMFC
jgi:hypothetical protein